MTTDIASIAAPEVRRFDILLPWGLSRQGVLLPVIRCHELSNAEEEILASTDEGPEENRQLELLCSIIESARQADPPEYTSEQRSDGGVTVTDRAELRELIRGMVDTDALFVLLEVRKQSLGATYEFDMACKFCGKSMPQEFNLNKVEVEDPNEPSDRIFRYRLPGRSDELVFRHMTVGDADLQAAAQRTNAADGKVLARALAAPLVSVNGEAAPQPKPNRDNKITLRSREEALERRVAWIERWLPTSGAKQACMEARRIYEAGADFILLATCPECAKQQRVRMPVEVSFFLTASREAPRKKQATPSGRQ